jgi:hypothetical protein
MMASFEPRCRWLAALPSQLSAVSAHNPKTSDGCAATPVSVGTT